MVLMAVECSLLLEPCGPRLHSTRPRMIQIAQQYKGTLTTPGAQHQAQREGSQHGRPGTEPPVEKAYRHVVRLEEGKHLPSAGAFMSQYESAFMHRHSRREQEHITWHGMA